jgi:isopenicillin N synthase-like dioxygenase
MQTLELRRVDMGDARHPFRHRLFVDAVCHAFSEMGFVEVVGHMITADYMAHADRVTDELFALPREKLLRHARPEHKYLRGYAPYTAETAKDMDRPDLKEFWMTRNPEEPFDPKNNPYGDNVWPHEVPEFKNVSLTLLRESVAVGEAILSALEEGFGLRAGSLVARTRGAETIQRTIMYRPLSDYPEEAREGAWRSAPHEDINFVTVMPCANAKGLALKLKGEWYAPETVRGSMIADTGEMLRLVPGLETLLPTTHAVMNPSEEDVGKSRASYPTFFHGLLYGNEVRSSPGSRELVDYAVPFLRRINEITRMG